tara:strand:+ start:358 stop:564 length:207 start_codon:yes stop_codon:yes gene_type:complete
MTKVFQLFTDLKEAKQFCYNHNMIGIERLVLVKCGCHRTQDVYYVMDGMSEIDRYINNWKMETLYVYE